MRRNSFVLSAHLTPICYQTYLSRKLLTVDIQYTNTFRCQL